MLENELNLGVQLFLPVTWALKVVKQEHQEAVTYIIHLDEGRLCASQCANNLGVIQKKRITRYFLWRQSKDNIVGVRMTIFKSPSSSLWLYDLEQVM